MGGPPSCFLWPRTPLYTCMQLLVPAIMFCMRRLTGFQVFSGIHPLQPQNTLQVDHRRLIIAPSSEPVLDTFVIETLVMLILT